VILSLAGAPFGPNMLISDVGIGVLPLGSPISSIQPIGPA